MLAAIQNDMDRVVEAVKGLDPVPHHDTGQGLAVGVAVYRDDERVMWIHLREDDIGHALNLALRVIADLGADAILLDWAANLPADELEGEWPLPPCPGGRVDALFAQWAHRDGTSGYRYVPYALGDDDKGIWAQPTSDVFPCGWVDALLVVANKRLASAFRKAKTIEEIVQERFAEKFETVKVSDATRAIDLFAALLISSSDASVALGTDDPFSEFETVTK